MNFLNVERPPDGIHLMPIRELSDLAKAVSVWGDRHYTPNSLGYLERTAKYNPNVGAFTADGTLVSWIFGCDDFNFSAVTLFSFIEKIASSFHKSGKSCG